MTNSLISWVISYFVNENRLPVKQNTLPYTGSSSEPNRFCNGVKCVSLSGVEDDPVLSKHIRYSLRTLELSGASNLTGLSKSRAQKPFWRGDLTKDSEHAS